MNNFDIISAWGGQIGNYNPNTCSNGGGYWQYGGGIAFNLNGNLVVIEVEDTSCGDFGTRFSVNVTCPTHNWGFYYGTMEDGEVPENILDSMDGVLGIDSWDAICEAFWAADSIAQWHMWNMEI